MNSINDLSADELFRLAEQKRVEEHETATAHLREELKLLNEKRKELLQDHKRTINDIDRQINSITKKIGGAPKSTSTTGRGRSGISKSIVEILSIHGPTATTQIKQLLDEKGVDAKNVSQQLAYLKRRGLVTNTARGVYGLVD